MALNLAVGFVEFIKDGIILDAHSTEVRVSGLLRDGIENPVKRQRNVFKITICFMSLSFTK